MKRQDVNESIRMALATLRAHKFRSFLTVLGVVIGTMTVMVIASFISGIDQKFQQVIQTFGTNTIWVYKFTPGMRINNITREERMRKPITYDDALAIKQSCPSVKHVTPLISPDEVMKVRFQHEELYVTQVQAVLPEYERMATIPIAEGRFFTELENQRREEECVIGADIADKFFPHVDALGKQILLNDKPFTVIGVYQKQDNFMMSENDGANQNRAIHIPYETMKKMYPQQKDNFVIAQAHEGRIEQAQDEIRQLLRRRRDVPYEKEDNFGISTPDTLNERFHQITGGIAILMVAISSVGLLIGGIGVMNIMLVSVTERTKEIGVRKAIGARRRDIMQQFLIEAMALTGSGGMLGIGIGWLLSLLVNMILPVYVPSWAPVMGLSVSVGIGLIFGLWPAMKAARLDPIEALRYE
jgi:putative ABC transport system permease protein